MTVVKNLGFIKAIHSAASPPTNTQMLWYDTNVFLHKYWDTIGSSWVGLLAGGTLASVMSVGNTTGGANIETSDGDYIKAVNGSGLLNLRDGANGAVTLGADVLTIDLATSMKVKVAAAEVANLTATGFSFGNATVADSHFQSNIAGASPTVNSAAFKIKEITTGTVNFTMGANAAYAWMSSWAGELYINPNSGYGVSIGDLNTNLASLDANLKFLVSSAGTTYSGIRRRNATYLSGLMFYTDTTLSHSITLDTSSHMTIANLTATGNIDFRVNSTDNPLLIRGSNNMVYMNMNYGITPDSLNNPTATIDVENISAIEFRVTGSPPAVTDITGGISGKMVHIHNVGSVNMTLKHNTGAATTKFFSYTGADVEIVPNHGVTLYYSVRNSYWTLLD